MVDRSMRSRSSDYHSVMNRVLLRFRPIAPKPVGGDAASGAAAQDRGNGAAAAVRRTKRKYVRVRPRVGKQSDRTRVTEEKKASPTENSGVEDESPPGKAVVTLQLLPERSEGSEANIAVEDNRRADRCCYADDAAASRETAADCGGGAADLRGVGSVAETWIIVECVTDKFAGVGLGFSDKERIYNLERDTCPGFISDGTNNVVWVNAAYRRMVAAAAEENGITVWLVIKDELPHFYPSFACRVRVIQRRGPGHNWNKIVPCDVWRMEFSGFAWKLDVNTALSLSL